MTVSATGLRARPCVLPALAAEAGPGVHRIEPTAREAPTRAALLQVPACWTRERAAPLALMLHGSGGDPQQALALLQPAAEAAGAIVLAPASLEYTWDGVLGSIGPDLEAIDGLLAWVFERYPIDARWLAVGGFSDGASYALAVALGNGELFRHCMALSPGFVPAMEQRGRPSVFISHGTGDRVLPIARCSHRIVPSLQRAGYDVDYREFDGGHEIPPAIANAAVRWWLG
ncbi:MAG TPA: alpha/beta hydrolase-fold protein [Ramlibacter sp.]|jgi:predicted esterase